MGDEKLAKLSMSARLLYIGTWNFADDYGVIKGNPVWIKNNIFPYNDVDQGKFNEWLAELVNGGWLFLFEINNEDYYYIPKFLKHQTINRPSQQRNPEPPKKLIEGPSGDDSTASGTVTLVDPGDGDYELAVLTKLPQDQYEKLVKAYPKINIPALFKECDLWHVGHPTVKRKDHYRTLLNWIKKYIEFGKKNHEKPTGKYDHLEA